MRLEQVRIKGAPVNHTGAYFPGSQARPNGYFREEVVTHTVGLRAGRGPDPKRKAGMRTQLLQDGDRWSL